MSDEFADHRVVVGRYLVAVVDVRVDAHTGTARHVSTVDGSGRGHEGIRIFGIDTALDGVAVDADIILAVAELFAGGDQDLFAYDIDAGDHFGHRVLHLNTGIHFNEVELAVLIQELKSTCSAITDIDAGLGAAATDLLAQLFADARCRGLFDDLLVAALHGAVALTEMNGIAVGVGQDLNLHMAWVFQEFLHIDHVVAEGGAGFVLGQGDGVEQVGLTVNHAHATTATATGSLDDNRVTDFTANSQVGVRVIAERTVGAGDGGDTGFFHRFDGGDLIPHQADGLGFWADEDETALFHALGKIGILGEEAITWVDGNGIRYFRGTDQGRDIEVAFSGGGRADADRFVRQAHMLEIAIGSGVHGNGLDAQLAAGAENAQGDLPSVGNYYLVKHRISACIPKWHHSMIKSGWPNSTGSPFSARMALITPPLSASIWFMIFIASMMHRVSPTLTLWPTSANTLAVGEGER